jgi:hypothetical protein
MVSIWLITGNLGFLVFLAITEFSRKKIWGLRFFLGIIELEPRIHQKIQNDPE